MMDAYEAAQEAAKAAWQEWHKARRRALRKPSDKNQRAERQAWARYVGLCTKQLRAA